MPHLPQVAAATIGVDEERLQLAYRLLEKWTDERSVPGGAIIVGRRGKAI